MIARRLLAWARIAPAGARADAPSALARAFLFSHMSDEDRYEAEIALTVMLDDHSPLVHCALAEAVAHATDVPHHFVTGLVSLGGEARGVSGIGRALGTGTSAGLLGGCENRTPWATGAPM